ncbi:hypothetical protein O9Z70_13730 [Devosia sp. YIM 151766]|uniref:hypothetical protein n=1 Tax=Devosia sp. YIM 151766 TaxID=3017325 RepID=UPI00255D1502|nr:hypothetical protein [Devosia sp. YIM 151766]WIY52502.1 hypothetical protein O9Z70_13730 [Devosia sp. YIM 151766]
MQQAEGERPDDGAQITLTPDMRPSRSADPDNGFSSAASRRPGGRLAIWLGLLGLLTGLAGFAAAAWTYTEARSESRRIASEIAQLRVSLELYGRNSGAMDQTGLIELANRVAVLEQDWRRDPAPAAAVNAPTGPAPGDEDCLPPGMRILVAEGDSYPVCGQSAAIDIAQVANGYVMLLDGTTIASGGSILLPDSPCSISVTSSGDEGLTGYAEIRVTC